MINLAPELLCDTSQCCGTQAAAEREEEQMDGALNNVYMYIYIYYVYAYRYTYMYILQRLINS